MFGIGKKKDKVQEQAESEEKKEVKKRRRRRTKKEIEAEEKKPWGKKERYLLFSILLVTVFSSGILALYARSWKLPNLPRVKVPDDVFEETFVIEKDPSQADVQESSKSKKIIEEFEKTTKKLSGVYGFEVIDLKTGARFGLNEDEQYQAASLIKLPVMTLFFEQAEKKRLNLSSKHSLQENEKIGGSGILQYKDPGFVIANEQLIEYMGQYSDNTAFNIAVNLLGEKSIEDYISDIGMRETSYQTNMTTIRDITSFYKKLWENRLTTEEHRDELLGYLTDTSYEQHLKAGVPENVRVAHKYGWEIHVVNDAGIVFIDDPYIVVIMSKGVVETEADKVFPELSKLIFSRMVN